MARLIDIGRLNLDKDLIKVLRNNDIILFERKIKFENTKYENKVLLSEWINNSEKCDLHFDYNKIISDEIIYFLHEREKKLPYSLSKFHHRLVDYIFNIATNLISNNIKEIIFNTTPHNLNTYILFRVAIHSGINVFWCNLTLLRSRYFVTKYSSNVRKYILPSKLNNNLSAEELKWVSERSSAYKLPYYEQQRKDNMLGSYYNLWVDISNWYKRLDLVYWKYKMNKKYSNLTKDFVLPKNYVLFSLHYQPERTTLPEANSFHNQMYALKILLQSIPKNTVVVAKEHPSTFSNMCHWKYRWSHYYLESENLVWAPINYNNGLLIKNSKIVASINGSICFEALLLKKKVVFFADNIFKLFDNVHCYSNIESLKKFLSKDEFIDISPIKSIEKFLHSADKFSSNSKIYKSFYLDFLK